jgi:SAM-dependent methyltransferase
MIHTAAWGRFNIWEHSRQVQELYIRRAQGLEVEMTCHAQAAELLETMGQPGDSVADLGCGTGYFSRSLQSRKLNFKYYGADSCYAFIEAGKAAHELLGIEPNRLVHSRIEDLEVDADHTVCSNIDNFHRPLERMLLGSRKTVILRESFASQASYSFVKDNYLDPEVNLKVHVNTYAEAEVEAFVRSYGFEPTWIEDRYTRGQAQLVIGYPHYWKFLVARRQAK